MGGSDSKNEKYWLGKVGRTYRKKWEGLTRKIRTHLGKHWPDKKWEGLSWKSGQDWLEKWEGLTRKMGRSDSKHGRSESKQGRSFSKTGRSGLTRKKVLMTPHSHRKNGYSLVQKPLLKTWPDNFFYYISVMKIVPKKSQKINMLSRNFYVKESLLDVP